MPCRCWDRPRRGLRRCRAAQGCGPRVRAVHPAQPGVLQGLPARGGGIPGGQRRGERGPRARGGVQGRGEEGRPDAAESDRGAAGVDGAGGLVRGRWGGRGTGRAGPPFKGPVGEWIQANIAKETFEEWIRQGTKVINELRLDLSREQDEEGYDAHSRGDLGIDEELYAKLTAGKEGTAGA